MNKLIVFDYDGTLVHRGHKVDQFIIENLLAWSKLGIHISIASGRNFRSLKKELSVLPIDIPIISNNGNIIRMLKSEATLYKNTIENGIVGLALETLQSFGVEPIFHVDGYVQGYDLVLINESNTIAKEYVGYYDNRYVLRCKSNLIQEDILSIVAYLDSDSFIKIKDIIQKTYPKISTHHLTKGITHRGMMEIIGEDCNKWTAVKFLAKNKGIIEEDIIALGDDMNDFEMILNSGKGIAMKDSKSELLSAANYISDVDSSQYGGILMVNKILNGEII